MAAKPKKPNMGKTVAEVTARQKAARAKTTQDLANKRTAAINAGRKKK